MEYNELSGIAEWAVDRLISEIDDRIKAKSPGRPCWFKHWSNPKVQPWQRGFFHAFAQEGEVPCAIVEKAVDGSLDTYSVDLVNFSEEKPA